jgi:tripartite-type tricarboxylate transporter receptor subunit TctC
MKKLVCIGLMALSCALGAAHAQSDHQYPDRPIRMLLPMSAGGGGDAFGRLLADHLSRKLEQPIVVENNPGASGTIGMAQVAKAAPDGYTISLGTFTSITLAPTVFPGLPYDPRKDFTTLARVGTAPVVLVVRDDFPAKDLREFIELAKKSDQPIQYGTWGPGSTGNFCAEVVAQKAGIHLEHVPFNGSAPAVTALLGGHINVAWLDIGSGTTAVQGGKVRALALCTQRTDSLPSVASYKEQGVDFDEWIGWGMYAPAGVPEPILEKLREAIKAVVNEPEVQKQMLGWGITPDYLSGSEQAGITARSIDIWKQIARDAGMKFN